MRIKPAHLMPGLMHRLMPRRRFMFILASLAVLAQVPAVSADRSRDEALWSSLKSGGFVILLRHAVTEAGIGDPPDFRLGDCSTQRNLSEQGRMDARRIGKAIRERGIPVQEVQSSRWCRCMETARLAFGHARPVPHLDSMFNDTEAARSKKARATFESIAAAQSSTSNLVLVTHAQNISALAGVSPGSGEMVIVKLIAPNKFQLAGRIDIPAE
jgi:phosphohistidine phosphatase SixA